MAKKTFTIRKSQSGIVTIKSGGYIESIDLRDKRPPEKFEAVRWAILTAGFAFTEEVEKIVRKELEM